MFLSKHNLPRNELQRFQREISDGFSKYRNNVRRVTSLKSELKTPLPTTDNGCTWGKPRKRTEKQQQLRSDIGRYGGKAEKPTHPHQDKGIEQQQDSR